MEGRILGFESKDKSGTIKGHDGNRYIFSLDSWKSNVTPVFDMMVDFEISEKKALNIYEIKDHSENNKKKILGILSLLLTFFLGFIGTLISRIGFSGHDLSRSTWPIFAHLIITLIAFLPIVGWIIYLLGTMYFMVKNYQYVQNPLKV